MAKPTNASNRKKATGVLRSSVILSAVDEKTFKRLGVNLTCQPRYKG